VLAVEPGRGHGGDEELRAVGVRSGVGHREGERPVVFGHAGGVAAKLVRKVAAPDGSAARAVSERAAACFDFDFVCEKCRGERRRSESEDALEEKEGWKEKNAISQTSLDKKKPENKTLRKKKRKSTHLGS
jgi:hypothetical protein